MAKKPSKGKDVPARVTANMAAAARNVRATTANDAVRPQTTTRVKPTSGGIRITRTTRF